MKPVLVGVQPALVRCIVVYEGQVVRVTVARHGYIANLLTARDIVDEQFAVAVGTHPHLFALG